MQYYKEMPVEKTVGNYLISTDRSKLQAHVIHQFLSEESYWAQHIPFAFVQAAIENSFCIGVYYGSQQVGFARVITDYSTFGYLADVFVLAEHRGNGLSKAILALLLELEWVQQLRRILLATKDAQGLYAQYGFRPIEKPERLMGIILHTSYCEQDTTA